MLLSLKMSPVKTEDILIGAQLRVPAQAIHRRLINELNAAGFDGLSIPHLAVLQFPGPDGVRPGTLAERAGMSKQAMNQPPRASKVLVISFGLMYQMRAARALSASPSADVPNTQKWSMYSATSNASGAPSLGPSASLSLRSC